MVIFEMRFEVLHVGEDDVFRVATPRGFAGTCHRLDPPRWLIYRMWLALSCKHTLPLTRYKSLHVPSHHFWVEVPQSDPTKRLFHKEQLLDGVPSPVGVAPSLKKSGRSATTEVCQRKHRYKAPLTTSNNAFCTQKWADVARDHVSRLRKTLH
jgi:hypothetical protein